MSGAKPQLSNSSIGLLKGFNWADYLLYNHFKARLYKEVEEIGTERVHAAKAEIERLSAQLKQECAETVQDDSDKATSMGAGPISYAPGPMVNPKVSLF